MNTSYNIPDSNANKKSSILELDDAVDLLLQHKPLGFPTETFYGLGCMALSSQALDLLCLLKQRDQKQKTFPLIIGCKEHLSQLVDAIHPEADPLIQTFWPGPLTLVLPARQDLDARIVGPGQGVAVRLTSHPIARELSKRAGGPIVSTSLNPSGEDPCIHLEQRERYPLLAEVAVLDGGTLPGGKPSTILSTLSYPFQILREGTISVEELNAVLSERIRIIQ